MAKSVVIVDSGSGNLRSVARALERVGAEVSICRDPGAITRAERIVVPGQGAFASCMESLRRTGGDDALREFIASGRPYLGICLGLQVLFEDSAERGIHSGLGIIPGHVLRLAGPEIRVPHIGWNSVGVTKPDPLLSGLPRPAFFYFVHSYYVEPADPALVALTCHHGIDFAAAIRLDNIFACQFHAEKSQTTGLAFLERFLELC